MEHEVKLSGGNYGWYVVVGGVAYLHDESGDVVDTISDNVTVTSEEITVNDWVYTIINGVAVFSGMIK